MALAIFILTLSLASRILRWRSGSFNNDAAVDDENDDDAFVLVADLFVGKEVAANVGIDNVLAEIVVGLFNGLKLATNASKCAFFCAIIAFIWSEFGVTFCVGLDSEGAGRKLGTPYRQSYQKKCLDL